MPDTARPKIPLSDIESCRKAARQLKKACDRNDTEAITRLRAFVPDRKIVRHADYLFVIAREAGHQSWPKLKFALETAAMSRVQRAERLKTALYFGQHWRVERLLADDPGLPASNLGLQIALFDLPSVAEVIEKDGDAATRSIGIRSPILHLAFSRELQRSPEKVDAMLGIAQLLVAHGADVDDGYPFEPGANHKLSALYGALCHADNFALGHWLLEQGANPNDDESLYHSTELGHTRALEALLTHGARIEGTNALLRALDFDNVTMVRLLLACGADPDIAVADHASGQPVNKIPSLHHAAQRGASAQVAQLLLDHGADPSLKWSGHSAYALARIFGNHAVADLLVARGADTALNPNEQVLAACADGKRNTGTLDLGHLHEEDQDLLTRLAFQPGNLMHMRALVAAGLDPDRTDSMGLPPLHVAGWNGLAEELTYFLSLAPDLVRKNDFGGDALDTVIHGAENAPRQDASDHLACARLLLEAGSQLYPEYINGCGDEELAAFLETVHAQE